MHISYLVNVEGMNRQTDDIIPSVSRRHNGPGLPLVGFTPWLLAGPGRYSPLPKSDDSLLACVLKEVSLQPHSRNLAVPALQDSVAKLPFPEPVSPRALRTCPPAFITGSPLAGSATPTLCPGSLCAWITSSRVLPRVTHCSLSLHLCRDWPSTLQDPVPQENVGPLCKHF